VEDLGIGGGSGKRVGEEGDDESYNLRITEGWTGVNLGLMEGGFLGMI
tara:strand:- start:569 stop:712 length:144 start_codon:yes stop_codon:yes gene_type:complete